MAHKAQQNTTVSYNGNAITNYVSQADLEAAMNRLEVTTLGDTAKAFLAEDPEWKISLSGYWTPTLDGYLAPDAISPGTKRTSVITMTDGVTTVTYTWTSNAEIGNYKIGSQVGGARSFSAELVLSGAPTRGVA